MHECAQDCCRAHLWPVAWPRLMEGPTVFRTLHACPSGYISYAQGPRHSACPIVGGGTLCIVRGVYAATAPPQGTGARARSARLASDFLEIIKGLYQYGRTSLHPGNPTLESTTCLIRRPCAFRLRTDLSDFSQRPAYQRETCRC